MPRYKLLAYFISAVYAGAAGGLFSAVVGAVVPDQFNLFQIVLQFCMVLVGGIGMIWGSVLGAIAIIGLQEMLRGLRRSSRKWALACCCCSRFFFLPGGFGAFLAKRVAGWREDLRNTSEDHAR